MNFDPRLFPTVLIVLDVAAAAGYAYSGGWGEWRMIGYWLAAALITFFVTF
ncbi:MAG: hypothetical protein LBV80_08055 [Deltaproteobacteria bacterium]|nr:hypothetical protein [Deltaproteobacteria bacterium]